MTVVSETSISFLTMGSILWFDCDFVFLSLYFLIVPGGKVIYLYSWFKSRVQVSDHWEFVVTAGVLNLWCTFGTRPLVLLHYCSTVHWAVCISAGPFSESSSLPLIAVFSFSAVRTGNGLLEILQVFFSVPLCSIYITIAPLHILLHFLAV